MELHWVSGGGIESVQTVRHKITEHLWSEYKRMSIFGVMDMGIHYMALELDCFVHVQHCQYETMNNHIQGQTKGEGNSILTK